MWGTHSSQTILPPALPALVHFWASSFSFPSSSSFCAAMSSIPQISAALRASRNWFSAFDSEMQKPFDTGSNGKSGSSNDAFAGDEVEAVRLSAEPQPPAFDKSHHLSSLRISLEEKEPLN